MSSYVGLALWDYCPPTHLHSSLPEIDGIIRTALPVWSPSPNVNLHPDSLVRVSDAELRSYVENPSTLIGKAFATMWQSEKQEFGHVYMVCAILDTGEEKYYVHVVPDLAGEAFRDPLRLLKTSQPVYVVPV